MSLDHRAEDFLIVRRMHWLQLDHAHVAPLFELPVLVEDVGDPARHPGGEIAAGPAEHDDDAAGHVFAAVIPRAFDDGPHAAVSHGKTLAGRAVEIALAGGRAV